MNLGPNIGRIVDTLGDYAVIIVPGADGTGEYAVTNTVYGVVEAQTPLLPQALEYLEQLQAGLDARRDSLADAAQVVDIALASAKGEAKH